jgi:hypothetical protein
MGLTVSNPRTEEEAAMFSDGQLDLAKQCADELAKAGQKWVVIKTTVTEELIYETSEESNDAT